MVVSAALLNDRHANTGGKLSKYGRTILVSHQRRLLPQGSIAGVVHNGDMLLLVRDPRDLKGERRSLAGVSYFMRRYSRLCRQWRHTGTGEMLLTCMSMISVSRLDKGFHMWYHQRLCPCQRVADASEMFAKYEENR
jgi:hypothetical protein